jgi:hypothetical protein
MSITTTVQSTPGPQASAWRTEALAGHRQPQLDQHALAQRLVTAIRRLTGSTLDPEGLIIDAPNQAAWSSFEDARVRWRQEQLVVVRPCAHCGCGAFASRPILSLRDLGYALSVWQPLHRDCRPFVADDST